MLERLQLGCVGENALDSDAIIIIIVVVVVVKSTGLRERANEDSYR